MFVDLRQPLYTGMPAMKVHGTATIRSEHPFPPDHVDGCLISVSHIELGLHVGTHVDAPRHFLPGGKTVADFGIDRFVRHTVTAHLPVEGEVPIGRAELRRALGPVTPGDFVFICFDYGRRFADEQYLSHPYLTRDAAELILELGATGLGVDVLTPDMPGHARPKGFDFPAHQTLLRNDVLIFENLGPGLTEIVDRRVPVSAVPFHIETDGSIVAPYATLPDE